MQGKLILTVVVCLAACVLVNSCSCRKREAGTGRVRKPAIIEISMSGDRLAAALYERWFHEFGRANPDARLVYLPAEAPTALTNLLAATVDLVSTDAKPERQKGTEEAGITAIPVSASAVVAVYNLPDIHELRLSREAYVGIVLGRVASWNDIPVRRYNRSVTLPDEQIRLIVDAQPGPTAHALSQHLAAISPEFAAKVGVSRLPPWPVGTRANGEEEVAAAIRATPYSLAFVDLASARRHGLDIARLQNWADNFVLPTSNSVLLALSEAKYPGSPTAWTGDPKAADAYPIVRYVWLICRNHYEKPEKQALLGSFLSYLLTAGQSETGLAGCFPLSSNLLSRGRAMIAPIASPQKGDGTGG